MMDMHYDDARAISSLGNRIMAIGTESTKCWLAVARLVRAMPLMTLNALSLSLILYVPFVSSIFANEVECAPPSDNLVRGLVDWVGAHSNYDVSRTRAAPPEILFCAPGDHIPYAELTTLVEPGELAYYDISRRRIYLVEPWLASETRDVGVLLHELVHDIQFQNRSWECPNAAEWEAYKLQALWQEQQGIEEEFDWLRIYFQSRCPRDIHP